MKVFEHPLYIEDINYISSLNYQWEKLQNKCVMITGATGQIGSMIIDVIMYKNQCENLNCTVYALGRNKERIDERFSYCCNNKNFIFIEYDVNEKINFSIENNIDFIFHLASNTHPLQYSTDPIGTITTNIIGLKNLLDYAVEKKCKRFIFASSNEIYGENRGDVERFTEDYCGYINCNTLRAGYPESKRCGEALCQAYISQKNLDVVIPRITRTYGPTLLKTDTKAMSQFLHKAIAKENIVLKSDGNQFYSYLYITDTVSGVLSVFFNGIIGEAYNISDESSDIRLKDLAKIIAEEVGTKVVFELPNQIEVKGFSKATIARLNENKLVSLGWKTKYCIKQGIIRTIKVLGEIKN